MFVCLDARSQRHSFDSNLTELDTILVWFTVPAHPTSDCSRCVSRVAAVIAQKTECCIASVITQEGQLSLSSGLATLFVFHSERGHKGSQKYRSQAQYKVRVFFSFSFFLCSLVLKFDRRLGDITIERVRQESSPGAPDIQSLQHQSACLPACLSDV